VACNRDWSKHIVLTSPYARFRIEHMAIATIQNIKDQVKAELIEEFFLPFLLNLKDTEGEYRPEFVKDAICALQEPRLGKYSAKELNQLISSP